MLRAKAVIKTAAYYLGINYNDIAHPSRTMINVMGRHACIYVLCSFDKKRRRGLNVYKNAYPWAKIAEIFNYKDHSAGVNAYKLAKSRYNEEIEFRDLVQFIKDNYKENINSDEYIVYKKDGITCLYHKSIEMLNKF